MSTGLRSQAVRRTTFRLLGLLTSASQRGGRVTKVEALELMGDGPRLRVVTRAGIEYDVDRAVVDAAKPEYRYYVYGHRVKAGGSVKRRIPANATRWFSLLNVKPVSAGRNDG